MQCLQEFPPKSKLDPNIYGNQDSTITRDQIEDELDGLTIDEVINTFILTITRFFDQFSSPVVVDSSDMIVGTII